MWQSIIGIVLGVAAAVLTLTKPAFFWEHHRARTMRQLIGDSGTTILYLIIALVVIGIGVSGLL